MCFFTIKTTSLLFKDNGEIEFSIIIRNKYTKSNVKFYPLCQWKGISIVQGIGLPTHVSFPRI